MALAYTAPSWTDGSGEGISASNLQAISNCIEGLVQGTDKAVHSVGINGSVITLTFADGTQESVTATGLKGILSITKTGTVGNVDTYTITYTDGTTDTFTVTNGQNPPGDGTLTISQNGTTVQTFTANQSGSASANIVTGEFIKSASPSSGSVTFTGVDDSMNSGGCGYDVFFDITSSSTNKSPYAKLTSISGEGTSNCTLTYQTDADDGTNTAHLYQYK